MEARYMFHPERGYVMHVVATDADFGMVRMFQTLSEECMNVQLFRDRREAKIWIRRRSEAVQGTES